MVIVNGAEYVLLCVLPNQSIKYRDDGGYVRIAYEGDYRIIESQKELTLS